ncbi:hypothetical protein GDO81_005301 [Engystomops pustulosus]|uniref:Uncharacterized protein n=1 Tax=Engystomops pustulosus TaxID=76066 RepID=A0AAV7CNV0_ENGPU|nr:hypothetical protein GDO81_005301 [Engystomops pustulosus]
MLFDAVVSKLYILAVLRETIHPHTIYQFAVTAFLRTGCCPVWAKVCSQAFWSIGFYHKHMWWGYTCGRFPNLELFYCRRILELLYKKHYNHIFITFHSDSKE